jgi:putative phage-type endonuclease
MRILKLVQGSPEWHEHRRNSLGATSASILAGDNPWKDKYDFYVEMVEGKMAFCNDSMRKGVEMEPEARAWCEAQLGVSLTTPTGQHYLYPFIHASFDGYNEERSIAVEIKCSEKCYREALEGIIPIYYRWQMQQQMEVAELTGMYYCAYWNGNGTLIFIERSEQMAQDLVSRAVSFYNDHILPKIPPESKEVIYEGLNSLSQDSGMALEVDLMNLEKVNEKLKELEILKEALRERVIDTCKGRNYEIGKWKITKTLVKGSVDYSKIPQLKGVNLDLYRKQSKEVWRIA